MLKTILDNLLLLNENLTCGSVLIKHNFFILTQFLAKYYEVSNKITQKEHDKLTKSNIIKGTYNIGQLLTRFVRFTIKSKLRILNYVTSN